MITEIIARGANKMKGFWFNLFMPKVNRFLLKGFNIQFGERCNIAAMPTYRISRKAKVIIGDNYRLSGSALINPLNNRRCSIAVSDNALLKIGNHVGMSSPTIWVHDSVIIGDHVNLGGVLSSWIPTVIP